MINASAAKSVGLGSNGSTTLSLVMPEDVSTKSPPVALTVIRCTSAS